MWDPYIGTELHKENQPPYHESVMPKRRRRLFSNRQNNSSQNQETAIFDKAYGGKQPESGHELWHFRKTNFKTIAESMGASAIRVEKPGELQGALEQALAIKDGPVVLDVVTDIEALAPRP